MTSIRSKTIVAPEWAQRVIRGEGDLMGEGSTGDSNGFPRTFNYFNSKLRSGHKESKRGEGDLMGEGPIHGGY